MGEQQKKILASHHLQHISVLHVDPEIFVQRLAPSSSMCHCNGTCCADGVLLDLREKDRILANAELIRKYLEPHQEIDSTKWFDNNIEDDVDFPSGKCDGTAVHGKGCVFLCSKGLCALQKTAMAEGMDKFALKPFYCVAFPLTIDSHTLTTYEPEFTRRVECCSIVPQGPLSVLDVCREEFQYVLGSDGVAEIEALFEESCKVSTGV